MQESEEQEDARYERQAIYWRDGTVVFLLVIALGFLLNAL
jgi:hypothetical protein